MATPKKTTKPKAKASSKTKSKPKSRGIGDYIGTAAKAALIPGYGLLSAGKAVDDYIQKKDPNLSKSKTYGAAKAPAKAVKKGMDYGADAVASVGKGIANVVLNPGKYIEKGAAAVGKYARKGMKAVDDYIEKADPNLSKSKVYGALKGVAKKAPKAIETGVGVAGKTAALFNPVTGIQTGAREVGKGARVVAKAADDAIEKADPYLAKSKTYGAIKGTAKSALGVKSGSTAKKSSSAKNASSSKKSVAANKSVSKAASYAKDAKTPYKPKVTGNSFLDIATGAKKASDYSVKSKSTTPAKTSSPTVSQLWQQKTGTSWSEAKKQGLTDGSAKSNIALMKKLQSGSVNKNTVKSMKAASDMTSFKNIMNQNVQDELSGKITFPPPVAANSSKGTADKAADENKMRRGGMVRRMKTGGMVNSNSKVSVIKSAGSKGVRRGANTRATAARAAKGRVGGISKAPRTATPKARMGMPVRRRR